mmetsp:Transcript_7098/g.9885  ORF Transcript_7098/g.9885 Transcript_7098/m.9885 type:complete len:128 (-) Transcript_7098:1493-1876(-)
MFSPNSGMFGCPLAMTDGAARLMEIITKNNSALDTKVKKRIGSSPGHDIVAQQVCQRTLERLTSRKPSEFWTSGQWMTERGGGSDVSDGTRTIAIPMSSKGGTEAHCSFFKLFGYKLLRYALVLLKY